ncbi:MAG: hypothetical protein AAF490_15865 [Chloroflexota bacterium]
MTLNAIYHTARADFLERVRSSGLILMLGLTAYLSYAFVPPLDASYTAVSLGGTRIFYNSAGIGLMFGITISMFVSLFAFYIIKNSIARDRQTRVGQIIGTTATSKTAYLLGKWASNVLFLSIIVGVMSLMAPVMQLLRGEASQIEIIQMWLPIWLLGLPMMSVVAGFALIFESVPFLRGGFGNVAYFFVWVFMLVVLLGGFEQGQILPDPYGVMEPLIQIYQELGVEEISLNLLGEKTSENEPVYQWHGRNWSATFLLGRLFWLGMGALLAVSGTLFFDRFNPANANAKKSSRVEKWWLALQSRLFSQKIDMGGKPVRQLTRLPHTTFKFQPLKLVLAELRLLLNGQPWYLFAGLIGLTIFSLVTPLADNGIGALYPLIGSILILSMLGAREPFFHTEQLVYATPRAHSRQLLTAWLAGVMVMLIFVAGYAVKLLLVGEMALLSGVLTAALFIPAMAMCLGTVSGTRRLFEIVFLVWWYMAINVTDGFLSWINFVNPQGGMGYLLSTLILLATAVFIRYAKTQK